MEKKTKFKRRMFAVAAIVGMGMTMTQIAFGKESLFLMWWSFIFLEW